MRKSEAPRARAASTNSRSLDGKDLGPHQASVADPSADGQGQHQVEQAGPKKGDKSDSQQDARKGKKGIHNEDIEQRIDPPSVKAGQAAENQS